MVEYPITLSHVDVRAILDVRKTQHRALIKPQPVLEDGLVLECPYGMRGDRLWVREVYAPRCFDRKVPAYRADYELPRTNGIVPPRGWKPASLMPRALSRIDLVIDSVRMDRLQNMTEEDAHEEGIEPEEGGHVDDALADVRMSPHLFAFARRWDALHRKRAPWRSNPLVWTIRFGRVRP